VGMNFYVICFRSIKFKYRVKHFNELESRVVICIFWKTCSNQERSQIFFRVYNFFVRTELFWKLGFILKKPLKIDKMTFHLGSRWVGFLTPSHWPLLPPNNLCNRNQKMKIVEAQKLYSIFTALSCSRTRSTISKPVVLKLFRRLRTKTGT